MTVIYYNWCSTWFGFYLNEVFNESDLKLSARETTNTSGIFINLTTENHAYYTSATYADSIVN